MLFSFYSPYNSSAKTTTESLDAKINALEDELKKAEEARKKATSAYNSAKDEYDDIKTHKEAIDAELDAIERESEALRSLLIGYNSQMEVINDKISKMESDLEEQLENLRSHLRLSYEDGNENYIAMLFSTDGLYNFLTAVERLSYLIDYDKTIISQIEGACEKLNNEKKTLNDITEAAAEKSAQLKETLLLLSDKQAETLKMMQDLEKDINKAKKAYLDAEKEADKFEAELEIRLAERAALSSGKYSGGAFIWPLPAKYSSVSSPFGYRIHPVTNKPQMHKGIDIPAPNKTEIYCVAKGTVIETGNDYANGKYVIIDHGGGISTMYAHLRTISVKKGDILDKGEVLGLVGMTGYATGYHLHLSVYENGVAADPMKYY